MTHQNNVSGQNVKDAANLLGDWFLKGLGAVGKVLNAGFTSPTYGTNGQVSYARNTKDATRQRKLYEASEEAAGKAMTWMSPLNYGVALTTGNGLNAKKGEEEVSSWSPFWQAVGRGAELYIGPKAVKGVKKAPAVIDKGLARAGSTSAKGRVIARELNKGIKENTKNGRIEVGPEYFKAEDKWYRVTERPEKIGLEELGMNVTTEDLKTNPSTVDKWRRSILSNNVEPGKGTNSGYFVKKPPKINVSIRRTPGRAHGNTSQAAKGQLWSGNFNQSGLFPAGILEGQAPMKVPFGLNRSHFVNTSWEDVPVGGRIGFHTGEMPIENLGWFQETSNGRYTYEPIIPEKRIQVQERPILVGLPYVRWSQEGYLNEARDVYPKGNPNQFFLIVTDVDNPVKGKFNNQGNGQYSLHFKTDRKKFRGNEKENMFKVLESMIPEGGVVSTWGHVSPGGYHAINRFGNQFGYSKVGERPGINGPIPIYKKTNPKNIVNVTSKELDYNSFLKWIPKELISKAPNDITVPGFTIKHRIKPDKFVEQYPLEILDRLEALGYSINPSLSNYIKTRPYAPSYIGYYNKNSNIGGEYFPELGFSIIDLPKSMKTLGHTLGTVLHETVMHATDTPIESLGAMKMYEQFNNHNYTKPIGRYNSLHPDIKHDLQNLGYIYKGNKYSGNITSPKETRATIGEAVKHLYSQANKGNPNIPNLKEVKPLFEKLVDTMSDKELRWILENINGYGKAMIDIGSNINPNFYNELRTLLKIGPVTIPFLISRKEEKK